MFIIATNGDTAVLKEHVESSIFVLHSEYKSHSFAPAVNVISTSIKLVPNRASGSTLIGLSSYIFNPNS
jgi:hypothetical protein